MKPHWISDASRSEAEVEAPIQEAPPSNARS